MPPGDEVDEVASTRESRALVVLGALTLLAALPRVVAALDAFWLDEIWTLDLARRTDSAWQVFTTLHHDNNHYLNTLWSRLLGPDVAWPLYRLPALAAGIATVYVAGRIEGRAGVREGVLAAALFGVSYPFVHYASEARGYGLVVLLALAAFALLERHHRRGGIRSAALFAAVAALGFLAHLTFLTVYGPLLAWSVWITVARRDSFRRALRLAAAHLVPLAVITALVLVDVRYLVRGGGPELPPLAGWLGAWGYTLGLPVGGARGAGCLAGFAAVVLLGLRERAREGEGAWIFFGLVLVMPLALLVALGAGYAPPRYFLVSLAFGLLLASRGLAHLSRRGTPLGVLAVALIAVVVVGNGWRVGRFLMDGRGAYGEAVRHLADRTVGDTIRVASDHDFRTTMVLDYYARVLPVSKTLDYVPEGPEEGPPPEWYLLSELGDDFSPPARWTPAREGRPWPNPYTLEAVFPKYGLSGWHWAVYRREASP